MIDVKKVQEGVRLILEGIGEDKFNKIEVNKSRLNIFFLFNISHLSIYF